MRILVTGGLGFIGSHVVQAALAQDHEVRVLDIRSVDQAAAAPDCSVLNEIFGKVGKVGSGPVEVLQGDVRSAEAVGGAVVGVDAVIHLAAKVGLGDGVSDAADYVSVNNVGTAVLISELANADIDRLVVASSMVVYGEGLGTCIDHGAVAPRARTEQRLAAGDFEALCPNCPEPLTPLLIDESAPLAPANVYATSKLAQEHLSANWARVVGGTATALRYHNVYGRRLPRDTPYAGVAALFVSMLRRGESPRVFEDGQQRRDFVHVRDVARATVAALQGDEPGACRAFNVGSGTPRTVGQMAQELAHATGGLAPTVTGQFRIGDVRHITASSQRAADQLRWSASESFAGGMAELALVDGR